MTDKIKAIKGAGNKNNLADAVRELIEAAPHIMQKMEVDAQLHRAKYLALQKEGFTNKEALELCKSIW